MPAAAACLLALQLAHAEEGRAQSALWGCFHLLVLQAAVARQTLSDCLEKSTGARRYEAACSVHLLVAK